MRGVPMSFVLPGNSSRKGYHSGGEINLFSGKKRSLSGRAEDFACSSQPSSAWQFSGFASQDNGAKKAQDNHLEPMEKTA
jgi:hypothetical protein